MLVWDSTHYPSIHEFENSDRRKRQCRVRNSARSGTLMQYDMMDSQSQGTRPFSPRQNWQRSFRNDGTIWGWGSVDEGRHVTQNSGFIGNKANEIWVVIRSSAIFWILERVSPIIHYHSLEKLTNYAYTTTNFWGMRYSSKLSENLWAEVSMKVTLDQISVDIRY